MKKLLCVFLCLLLLSTTALASMRDGYSSDDPEQWDDWDDWEYIDYGFLEGCAFNPYTGEWLDRDWDCCYPSASDYFETIEYYWSDEWQMWAGPEGFIDEDYEFHEYDLSEGYIEDWEYHLFPDEQPEICPECGGTDGEHDEDCPIYLKDLQTGQGEEYTVRDSDLLVYAGIAVICYIVYLVLKRKK